MSEEKKAYSSKRWTDAPVPTVVGKIELTEEEKRQNEKHLEGIMRKYGALKPDEHIENGTVVKK